MTWWIGLKRFIVFRIFRTLTRDDQVYMIGSLAGRLEGGLTQNEKVMIDVYIARIQIRKAARDLPRGLNERPMGAGRGSRTSSPNTPQGRPGPRRTR